MSLTNAPERPSLSPSRILSRMPAPRDRDRTPGPALCALGLVGVVALCVLVPLLAAAIASLTGEAPAIETAAAPTTAPVEASLLIALGRTIVVAGAIALFATLLAIPGAWVIREGSPGGARRAALCVGVLMLPNYLAYAGLNLLRAPMTPLADWLADQPPSLQVFTGHVIAVVGLALWAWPAAAIVLSLSLRRLAQDQLDALALSGAGVASRWGVLVRAMVPGLAAAFGVVFLLMIGSPVPLHVAQLDTYAVTLWRRLNQTGDPLAAWTAAWPMILLAGTLAFFFTRALSRRLVADSDPTPPARAAAPSRPARVALGVVLALSLALPLALHALATAPPGKPFSLHALTHTTVMFWRESTDALRASTITGALCALAFIAITFATWACLSCTPRRRPSLVRTLALVGVGILLAAAITPGAILGSMAAGAWTVIGPLRALADTPLPVVCVHTARFGAIAALLGVWAAALEPAVLRDQRELDGPSSLSTFFRACVRANWPAAIASGLAGFVLSLHEIESTVFVQPPGSGNLAQKLLDALHYSRDDRLGAATISLVVVSLTLAYIAAWLLTRPRRDGQVAP